MSQLLPYIYGTVAFVVVICVIAIISFLFYKKNRVFLKNMYAANKYTKEQNSSDALKHFKIALEAADSRENVSLCHYGIGFSYEQLGETDNAIKAMEWSLNHFFSHDVAVHLASIYVETGCSDKAESLLHSVFDDNGCDLDACIMLATIYKDSSRLSEAVEILNAAELINKRNPAVYALRADTHFVLGNPKAAVEDAKAALALDPGNEDCLRILNSIGPL